ncbi:MAG: sugar phosphate isomerase/epimerase family protein [Spirochaetota bacterium]
MKAGLCTIALQKHSVFEAIDMAKAAGAQSVEIWGKPPHTPYPIDEAHLARVRMHARNAGIAVAAYGSYYNAGGMVEVNGATLTAEGELAIARALGAPCIRIWPGKKEQKDLSPVDIDAVIRDIRVIGDKALAAGIAIVLERHCNTITSAWDGVDVLMKRIGHPNIFLNYQIPYPSSAEDYEKRSADDHKTLMPFAHHVHLQNYVRDTSVRNPKRTFLAEGVVDYAKFGAAAKASGFTGYAMVEFLADKADMSETELIRRDIDFIRTL